VFTSAKNMASKMHCDKQKSQCRIRRCVPTLLLTARGVYAAST
jgi:hypothetical protein